MRSLRVVPLAFGLCLGVPRPAGAEGLIWSLAEEPPVVLERVQAARISTPHGTELHFMMHVEPAATDRYGLWTVPVARRAALAPSTEALFTALAEETAVAVTREVRADRCGGPGHAVAVPRSPPPPARDGGAVVALAPTRLAVPRGYSVAELIAAGAYEPDPLQVPLAQEYVDEGFEFRQMPVYIPAETTRFGPMVVRSQGRLDAMFRAWRGEDVVLDLWVAAADFVAPTDTPIGVVNDLSHDWRRSPADWPTREAITAALDAPALDSGGLLLALRRDGPVTRPLTDARWQPVAFSEVERSGLVAELRDQGVVDCQVEEGRPPSCMPTLAAVDRLLRQWLPPGPGVDAATQWGCWLDAVACDESALPDFDGTAFAESFKREVVAPARAAESALRGAPSVGRWRTELTHARGLADVGWEPCDVKPDQTVALRSELRRFCSGDELVTAPSGRAVFVQADAEGEPGPWPGLLAQGMPAVTEVLSCRDSAVEVRADHNAVIERRLRAHNAAHGWPPPGATDGGTESGTTGAGAFESDGGCRLSRPGRTRHRLAWGFAAGLGLAFFGARRPTERRLPRRGDPGESGPR